MKVALLGTRGIPASYSGFETFYEQFGSRLAAKGHEVTVYNRSHHIKYRGTYFKGVRLVRLPSIPTKHFDTLIHTFISMFHALFTGYDVYLVCIVGNSPICMIARFLGKKVVFNVDGADADREKWKGFAKKYIRFCEKLTPYAANTIIADSTIISKRYHEKFKCDTVFIPYGANILPRNKYSCQTGILDKLHLEKNNYILFVSRLTPENKAHILIEAFKRSQTNLKLVIVGDAPYMKKYSNQLKAQRNKKIIMTGYLFKDYYRDLSSNCNFFVLPAGIDGTRPVLLDQMGFGNCVVVRDTPANMEVIADAGLAFRSDDEINSLKENIEELSGNFEKVKKYRKLAIDRVTSNYSWESVVDRYEEIFYKLIHEHT